MTITLEEAEEKLMAMIDRHACDEGVFIEVKKDIWYVMTPYHSEECDELSPCDPISCWMQGHGYRTSDGMYHTYLDRAIRYKRQLKKEERESRGR